MVRIRLKRMGTKKRPFYRIVVVDQRKKRDGKIIENVGYYNPLGNEKELVIKEDRVEDWYNKGAQPSNTVWKLIKSKGITLKKLTNNISQ